MTEPEVPSLPAEHVTIDAIEGKYARLELPDGTTADWLLSSLPDGVQEGDILAVSDEGNCIEIDHAETQNRKAQAQAKVEALNQAVPSGEITL